MLFIVVIGIIIVIIVIILIVRIIVIIHSYYSSHLIIYQVLVLPSDKVLCLSDACYDRVTKNFGQKTISD